MDADLDKKQKQLWLMEQVAENGYDTSKFNAFYSQKYGQKLVLEQVHINQLTKVVDEFRES